MTDLIAFEVRYHLRRPTFLAAALFFGVMGFALSASGFGGPEVVVNGHFAVARAIGFLSLLSVFVMTLFCAQSALRDTDHRMAEIVASTSVRSSRLVLGRYAGVVIAGGIAFLGSGAGMVVGALVAAGRDPSRLGPWSPAPYAWSFATLALPDLLIIAALLFAIAALTRSTLATYVGGAALYVCYFVAALFGGSPLMATSAPPTPERLAVGALIDPFGLSAVLEQTNFWSVDERNQRALDFAGHLLLNRILWLAVAMLVLAAVVRALDPRRALARGGRKIRRETAAPPAAIDGASAPGTTTAGSTTAEPATATPEESVGRRGRWSALWSAAGLELRHGLRGWPFAVFLVLWVAVLGMELEQQLRHTEFGTALLPTTGLMLATIQPAHQLFGLLLVVFFSAELMWRERSTGMAEIVDATPASSGLFLAAKALALAALLGVLALVAAAVTLGFQLAVGGATAELALYPPFFAYLLLPPAYLAGLAVLIQSLCPNRHVGMFLTLGAAVFLHFGALGGPSDPLLRFAGAPEVTYSDQAGFSSAWRSYGWFMAYWGLATGLLVLVALAIWRRGTDPRLRLRVRAIPRSWRASGRRAALALGVAFAAMAGYGFYQTHVVVPYETSDDVATWKADYERTYGHLATAPQPQIIDVHTEVALYPRERRADLSGTYTLENQSQEPIEAVWLATRRGLAGVSLRLGGVLPTSHDERFEMWEFRLTEPMQPGEQVLLDFTVEIRPQALDSQAPDLSIAENGTFVLGFRFYPSLGYRRTYELQDPKERTRHRLPATSRPGTLRGALAAGLGETHASWIRYDAVISTEADQLVVAPGDLVERRQDGDRAIFRFVSAERMNPIHGFVSARYHVRSRHYAGTRGPVEVEIYFHPSHDRNVDHLLDAAVRSLAVFEERFGPYPQGHLRIAEIPSHWQQFAGFAIPAVIVFVEDRGFLTDLRYPDRLDIVTKRVAHEVSHQWWGHQLSPTDLPGASTLVESFARYSELMVLQEVCGDECVTQALEVELDRYLSGRTAGDDAPLVDVEGQNYVCYAKGALITTATADLIGRAAFDAALRRLMTEKAGPDGRPTAEDWMTVLHDATPAEHRALVESWWRSIVLYDLGITSATYQQRADGKYEVTARVAAKKWRMDEGSEESRPFDEAIDILVTNEAGDELLRRRQPILDGEELAWLVDERPSLIVLDPDLRRIDVNRADNQRALR